mmetsp:Transcript_22798/g.19815  ORF Transcript_22798/g.19815 Transcript_22798/m.19815 type:complete len:157 (+) Transcript_22798:252-722(+)|eukprot:CAMPEP_0114595222 /NCGR_PEP_ID=MMETSP0125-20121206/16997_1 /TAXON_ID=485358 ORGANISM="Aristerostoma sp., Strain ATCC 50986" /NCGR_SAMPLE_ID=MMETSP0125 /ASSEMBLY_ACC=CAM_ASM_000245 /LENGTH=156 /DNA_ID=CAMNT_0001796547 /DNA_START=190 /DNA_END=660 /DNA_ORIENTATION=+
MKGSWSEEEDQLLLEYVEKYGQGRWSEISRMIPGRSSKQCREHYQNSLKPGVRRGHWNEEEDVQIFRCFTKHGTSWSKYTKYLPGRSENSIKNRFYSTLRKIAADNMKEMIGGGPGNLTTTAISNPGFKLNNNFSALQDLGRIQNDQNFINNLKKM